MDIEDLKHLINNIIDQWYEKQPQVESEEATIEFTPEEPKKELPKDKRAVRTPGQGDKVFVLDEIKKVRHWAHNPEALATEGFGLEDVVEIPDAELIKYTMGPAIFKPM